MLFHQFTQFCVIKYLHCNIMNAIYVASLQEVKILQLLKQGH